MKKLVSLVLALCMLASLAVVAYADEPVEISLYRCSFQVANPDTVQVKKVEDAINA